MKNTHQFLKDFTYLQSDKVLSFKAWDKINSSDVPFKTWTLIKEWYLKEFPVYYYICSGWTVRMDTNENWQYTAFRKWENNYFETEAEAIAVANKKREMHKLDAEITDAVIKLQNLISKKK